MQTAKVIVGANLGDEGKGLMTDYYAQSFGDIVVRFNGGAQAAHTVELPDGRRHVFGHFGSGSLRGKPTYLSRFFVVNPMVFAKERKSLVSQGCNPVVLVDPDCIVTTPYDMLINQSLERSRGTNRHGSCGIGFNEAIQRSQDSRFDLRVSDLDPRRSDFRDTLSKIVDIKDHYCTKRFRELGLIDQYNIRSSPNLLGDFIDSLRWFMKNTIVSDAEILLRAKEIIFEGAQGLMLDEHHEWFPHVTRSKTGIHNVDQIMNDIRPDSIDLEITYVSRCYMTRHGAGPLPGEHTLTDFSPVDNTNKKNEFQGHLRHAPLDFDLLHQRIAKDLQILNSGYRPGVTLAITCLDQMARVFNGKIKGIVDGSLCLTEIDDLMSRLKSATGHSILMNYSSITPHLMMEF